MFVCLFGAIGLGIVIGGLVGWSLGALSPTLIEFFLGEGRAGNPAKTGLALGLLNGAIYGFFGGAVILIAGAIVSRRKDGSHPSRNAQNPDSDHQ